MSVSSKLIAYVQKNPGCLSGDVRAATKNKSTATYLSNLVRAEKIIRTGTPQNFKYYTPDASIPSEEMVNSPGKKGVGIPLDAIPRPNGAKRTKAPRQEQQTLRFVLKVGSELTFSVNGQNIRIAAEK